MASNRIKGITIEIGGDTTGLSAALGDVNKKINGTAKELRDVERLLKLDPKNTELLAQKQKLLTDRVVETKTKLDALKNAEKQVQEQFKKGEASQQQVDALTREIVETEAALNSAKEAVKDFGSVAKQQFEATKQSVAKAADGIKQKADAVSTAFAPATKAFGGLAAAAVATVPATAELREDLSKLDVNAEENGVAIDKAREAWRAFAVQSGETDSAVEATSNLLQAGFTESNLQKAVEGLAGAAQRFPDTLKVESLADSLQETLATGAATGQFAEMLERLGMSTETFNEQLAAMGTEAEKQDFILQTMASAGLNDTYEAWKKNNEEMLANKEANLEWEETMAKVAEEVLPLVTKVTGFITDLVNWFLNLDDGTKGLIITIAAFVASISPVAGAISKVSGAISFLIANPIVALIAAIVALVVLIATKGDEIKAILQKVDDFFQKVFAKDWTEVLGPVLGDALNMFFANVKNIWNSVKQILDGIIDFIRGVFTGDWKRAWEGIRSIFKGIWDGLKAAVKVPLNAIIKMINGAINGINLIIKGLNKIPGVNIGEVGKIPYLAKGGIVSKGSAVVGEAGPELLTVSGGSTMVQPLTNYTTNNHTSNLGGLTVNVYGAPGQDVNDLADLVAERIEDMAARKGAVFA